LFVTARAIKERGTKWRAGENGGGWAIVVEAVGQRIRAQVFGLGETTNRYRAGTARTIVAALGGEREEPAVAKAAVIAREDLAVLPLAATFTLELARGLSSGAVLAPKRRGSAVSLARDVHRLQRLAGNRATARALGARPQRMLERESTSTGFELERPAPLRADEPTGNFLPTIEVPRPTRLVDGTQVVLAVFLPYGWVVKNNFLDPAALNVKVHVFFGASRSVGARGNDMLLHGLRSASNTTDWITIGVPGNVKDNDSFATPFTDGDITACLAAAGIQSAVSSLRLSGHSRGAVSLVNYVPKMGSAMKSAIDRVTLLDEFSFQGKSKMASLASEIPPTKLVAYESGNRDIAATKTRLTALGAQYHTLNSDLMSVIGCTRLIQDAMALNPSIATKAASTRTTQGRTIKDEMDTLPLPPRGSFTTKGVAGKRSFEEFAKANKDAIAKMPVGRLVSFINGNDLTRWGGIDWGPFTAHEFFVAEIAHELYD
jgi:hypothetical protein